MGVPLILVLDGATRVCGAALLSPGQGATWRVAQGGPCGWRLVAERRESDSRGQAKLLLRMVDDMLHDLQLGPTDLAAIVVGVGPGTFTGVRIAVATARALGLALRIPVTGVSTLSALAASGAATVAAREAAARPVDKVVAVVDARRGQVFYGVYDRGADGLSWVRSMPFAVCDQAALGGTLGAGAKPGATALIVSEDQELVGTLSEAAEVLVESVDPSRLVLGQDALVEPGEAPLGRRLTAWLVEALAGRATGAPEFVKPIYVRSPDADIHITKMRDPWSELPEAPRKKGGR